MDDSNVKKLDDAPCSDRSDTSMVSLTRAVIHLVHLYLSSSCSSERFVTLLASFCCSYDLERILLS